MSLHPKKRSQLQGRLLNSTARPSAAEAAGIFSFQHLFRLSRPMTRQTIEQAAVDLLLTAGSRATAEGIIPGHLKLLIKADHAGLVLSMTRPGAIDRSVLGEWEAQAKIANFVLTVNFLLISPVTFSADSMIRQLTVSLAGRQ